MKKVCLVPMQEEHIARYLALSDDPELISAMGWTPFQHDERGRFLQSLETATIPGHASGLPIRLSIVTSKDGIPIGYVVLIRLASAKNTAELAIAIMERGYREGGYGSKALRLAIAYAFETLQVSRIMLTVFPHNSRAIHVYEQCGFKKTRLLTKAWTLPDYTKADMLLMELEKAQMAEPGA